MVGVYGGKLFHVAFADPQPLNHCASVALYEYVNCIGSGCAGAV